MTNEAKTILPEPRAPMPSVLAHVRPKVHSQHATCTGAEGDTRCIFPRMATSLMSLYIENTSEDMENTCEVSIEYCFNPKFDADNVFLPDESNWYVDPDPLTVVPKAPMAMAITQGCYKVRIAGEEDSPLAVFAWYTG